jgi:hypothetical protein
MQVTVDTTFLLQETITDPPTKAIQVIINIFLRRAVVAIFLLMRGITKPLRPTAQPVPLVGAIIQAQPNSTETGSPPTVIRERLWEQPPQIITMFAILIFKIRDHHLKFSV